MTVLQPSPVCFEWLTFRQPAVRDLAFALASPPLLSQWPTEFAPHRTIDLPDDQFWQYHFQRYLPRLRALDDDPTELNQSLAKLSSSRLGIRFEALLSFWLNDHSNHWHDFELLAKNIQLKDEKRTIGEVDFIIENKLTHEIEHWELSLKFYLGEASLRPFEWRGLNDLDTFGRKIKHTVQKQFNVDQIDLPLLGTKTIQKRRAIFKGRLFYPDHVNETANASLSTWLHPQHLRGTWGYTLPLNINWRRAARREWLTPEQNPTAQIKPIFLIHGLYLGQSLEPEENKILAPIERMIRVLKLPIPFSKTYNSRLQRTNVACK
ncbi:MAG: DUF1853 family protein [Candidatus Saccharibacteria bacterium]|nr:DUF1853 family protein [Moraxellaceae bacterium]